MVEIRKPWFEKFIEDSARRKLGEELTELELMEKMEMIAPEEWLLDVELANKRFDIERNLDKARKGVDDCICSQVVEAVGDGTDKHVMLWMLLNKSEKIPEDKKKPLRDDLIKILTELKDTIPSRFAFNCECTTRYVKTSAFGQNVPMRDPASDEDAFI